MSRRIIQLTQEEIIKPEMENKYVLDQEIHNENKDLNIITSAKLHGFNLKKSNRSRI